MTFAATDMRFGNCSVDLLAIRGDLYAAPEQRAQRSAYGGMQLEEFACISL